MLMVLAALLAQPSAEAVTLGREVAESGTLAALLPIIAQRDVEELIAAHPELSAAEQAQLRATADRVFAAGRDRLMAANGQAYAERLSVEQLRAIAAFNRTPAAAALREATPGAMLATMQAMGSIDLKRDIAEAFCRETRQLCPPGR